MLNHISKILIVGIIGSVITSLGRADYNLPLFLFSYMLWEFEKFHTRIIYMLMFAFMIDFVYLLYWYMYWNQFYLLTKYYDGFLQILVLIVGILNMIIKLLVVMISIIYDQQVKHNMGIGQMKDNLVNFIGFSNNDDD